MNFAQLIASDGPWNKVWLAAHWDKKLKKQDYDDFDLRVLIVSFLEHRGLVSLRATGHLLIGTCKIYSKKCLSFEDEAREIQTRLMLAFTEEEKATKADPEEDAIRVVDPDRAERAGVSEDAMLQGGKKHCARLEDITLKPSEAIVHFQPKDNDVFGVMTSSELEQAMSQLQSSLPDTPALANEVYDTLPLVATDPEVGGRALLCLEDPFEPVDLETPLPLDMDMHAPEEVLMPLAYPSPQASYSLADVDMETDAMDTAPIEDGVAPIEDGLAPIEDGLAPADDGMAVLDNLVAAMDEGFEEVLGFCEAQEVVERVDVAEVPATAETDTASVEHPQKRRRRVNILMDELTEIPKETYQAYVNDRSSITRKNLLDFQVLLPHNTPNMPSFTTTFTDLCPSLVQCLLLGTEVAEKRRRSAHEAELLGRSEAVKQATNLGIGISPALTAPAPVAPPAATAPEASVLVPPAFPVPPVPKEPEPVRPEPQKDPQPEKSPAQKERVEAVLLQNAPLNMGGVITGSMDQEDQAANQAARIGYSGRTEKMHRFLAKTFQDESSDALSYQSLCKTQAAGRRELIAGCFFELLVLKTNGVITLQQEQAYSDIRIAKATSWAN